MKRIFIAFALLLVSCGTPTHRFLHETHRIRYGITDADFPQLQFYISGEVIGHSLTEGDEGGIAIVSAGTPGIVRAAGPHWLRVSFSPNGEGVYFLAKERDRNSLYKLATETPKGLQRLETLPDPILTRGKRSFRIVAGANAHLIINLDDLEALIESRPHLQGVER